MNSRLVRNALRVVLHLIGARRQDRHAHFTAEKAEALRGQVTYSTWQSQD